MIDEKVKIPKFKRAKINYKKVTTEDLKEAIQIEGFENILTLNDFHKLPHKLEDDYIYRGVSFCIEEFCGEKLVIRINESGIWGEGDEIKIKKGDIILKEEFDRIIKLMKKAGERLAKIRDEYYKELKKKKEEWEDGEVKEIII